MSPIRSIDIPRRAPQEQWRQMPTDSMELYILSKVDGRTRVEELALLCAKSIEETVQIVEHLVSMGVLLFPSHKASVSTSQEHCQIPPSDGTNYLIHERHLNPLDSDAAAPFLSAEVHLSPQHRVELLRVHDSIKELNPFQIFSVGRDATDREIKRAYQKLTLRYHPDRFYGKRVGLFQPLIEEIFKLISKSYDLISTQTSRDNLAKVYDEWLTEQEHLEKEIQAKESTSPPSPPSLRDRQRRRSQIRKRLQKITGERHSPAESAQMSAVPMERTRLEERKKRHRRKFIPLGLKERIDKAAQHLEEGKVLLEREEWAQATSHLNMALSLDPKNPEIQELQKRAERNTNALLAANYTKRANVEKELGNYEKAGRLYALATEISDDMECAIRAASCFSRIGDHVKAKKYALLAKERSNGLVRGDLTLAKVYVKAGLLNRASSILKEILERHPDNREAQRLLKQTKKL